MTSQLAPYPEYRESGVASIGEIPKHWGLCRLKNLVSMNHDTLTEMTDPDYRFSYLDISAVGTGYLRHKPSSQRFGDAPSRARRRIHRGDTIVSTVRPYLRAVHHFANDIDHLVASTGFAVLTPGQAVCGEFLGYLAQSDAFVDQVVSDSIGAAYPATDEFRLGNTILPLPPNLCEQAAIARFLRTATATISRFIRNRRRLIALLNEQKQAIINQAVTQGLDPNVRLKPSGVDWLGDIPEHWTVAPLKFLCDMNSGEGITSLQIEETGAYPVYGGNGLRGYSSSYTHDGDFILVGRQGALCGNVHLASGRFWASEHAIVTAPRRNLNAGWLKNLLAAMQLRQYSIAAAQPGLAVERILNLRVPLPSVEEQEAIASQLNTLLMDVNRSVNLAKREVELVREYRTRLISDVVTGKVDVRGLAPAIDAEPFEPSLEEDLEDEDLSEDDELKVSVGDVNADE